MKKIIALILLLSFCLGVFTACEPVLPDDNIAVLSAVIKINEAVEIEVIYPNTDDTAVVKWTGQKIEIIEGTDIVEVSGLTVTGIKSGTAILKAEAAANCSYMGIIMSKPVYTTEFTITVE